MSHKTGHGCIIFIMQPLPVYIYSQWYLELCLKWGWRPFPVFLARSGQKLCPQFSPAHIDALHLPCLHFLSIHSSWGQHSFPIFFPLQLSITYFSVFLGNKKRDTKSSIQETSQPPDSVKIISPHWLCPGLGWELYTMIYGKGEGVTVGQQAVIIYIFKSKTNISKKKMPIEWKSQILSVLERED